MTDLFGTLVRRTATPFGEVQVFKSDGAYWARTRGRDGGLKCVGTGPTSEKALDAARERLATIDEEGSPVFHDFQEFSRRRRALREAQGVPGVEILAEIDTEYDLYEECRGAV